MNGDGILSTEADRISRKPGAGGHGHVDGLEFQESGSGSQEFSNPAVFMLRRGCSLTQDSNAVSLPSGRDSVFAVWTWR